MKRQKLPLGIQSFERLRRDDYLYVDKTHIVYELAHSGSYYFLSRPRRFGKSLLLSTIQAYFEGKKELFADLALAEREVEWKKHPVLYLDLNTGNYDKPEALQQKLEASLSEWEESYGRNAVEKSIPLRFEGIIKRACQKTGERVVILVDEYDKPLLQAIGNDDLQNEYRKMLKAFYGALKSDDQYIRFAFLTGVTKFGKVSIFSDLNNLTDLSRDWRYYDICGINDEELVHYFTPYIEQFAHADNMSVKEVTDKLRKMYDGYHFSERMCDMYNPFSLFNAFETQKIDNYWFDRGTSSSLIDILAQMPDIDFAEIENVRVPSTAFDLPLESLDDPLPVLYQSGYLTIKDYVKRRGIYVLGFPNNEVRKGFADCLFKHVAGKKINTRQTSALLDAYYDFYDTDDLTAFIEAIKTFYASVPYHLDNQNEHHYHALLYTLLTSFGADVKAEEPTAKGRADIVLRMPLGIYIMEIKYDSTAAEALEQINQKGYADKYLIEGRPITKVGIAFSSQERNIIEWEKEK